MKSIFSFLGRISPLIFVCIAAVAQSATPVAQPRVAPEILKVSEIHRGMRGVAYTVFEGVKPESMDVEVLGILPNLNGPKSDLILARLRGEKVEYTGVVAGMWARFRIASANFPRSRSAALRRSKRCSRSTLWIARSPSP